MGNSNSELLARRLERDIQRRGLAAGDRFQTAKETAQLFDVSLAAAHRALKILADRHLLVRRRKGGTFIGAGVNSAQATIRKRVHIITAADVGWNYEEAIGYLSERFLTGIAFELPATSIQIDSIPPGDGMAFIRDLTDQAQANGDLAGLVLVRNTFEMQWFFQERHLPAVVYGSVYPGITELPWIEDDQVRIGELATRYVLDHGYRRLAILMFDHWSPGDSIFMSGVMNTLERFRRKIECSQVFSLPPIQTPIGHLIDDLLSRNNRPFALIVRGTLMAKIVKQITATKGLAIPKDLALVIGNVCEEAALGQELPHATQKIDALRRGQMVGRMLKELNSAARPNPDHYIIPVAFPAPLRAA